ncbi:unnamed protein product [Zymoseptoria tritici ST99CH_1A5]|uniref:Uncharacterized protein n=1 Tax=Zymoseptoria tritici ST99CH_1A5 TaxID=1276529 RepID=A0A1Y6LSA5_ZYMTR|nr:unnamed protein product [Zymoseptoria tritici ST99CH_1A5]
MKSMRTLFQGLMESCALASIENPRSRQVTLVPARRNARASSRAPSPAAAAGSRAPSPAAASRAGSPDDAPSDLITYRSKQYRADMKRPNVYMGMHYDMVFAEYGTPVHASVLPGERMHKEFKRQIYNTNMRNPERNLLQRIGVDITLRLVVQNGFPDELALTAKIQAAASECTKMFDRILPKSDQASTSAVVGDEAQSDPAYTNARTTDRYKIEICRSRLKIQAVYAHYGKPEIIIGNNRPLKYWNTLAFDDALASQRHIIYRVGDFVRYGNSGHIGRVKHIFTHQATAYSIPFSFLRITRAVPMLLADGRQTEDVIIKCAMYQNGADADDVIVGLPQISSHKIWVVPCKMELGVIINRVPTNKVVASTHLIFVNWDVQNQTSGRPSTNSALNPKARPSKCDAVQRLSTSPVLSFFSTQSLFPAVHSGFPALLQVHFCESPHTKVHLAFCSAGRLRVLFCLMQAIDFLRRPRHYATEQPSDRRETTERTGRARRTSETEVQMNREVDRDRWIETDLVEMCNRR